MNLPFSLRAHHAETTQETARLTCMQGMHYGTPPANSLHLVKYYFEKHPEDASKVVLSIKGAFDAKTGA
jgi:uncharacterized protein with von Willebrand factor type A (vWA) domain